jgi:hypothetical protein
MGVKTYNYDQNIIQYAMPEILNDKEFMLEIIKETPHIAEYISKSKLVHDKDFILKLISTVSYESLSSLYGNIPSDSPLKEDKEIINKMLDAGGNSISGAGKIIKSFLMKNKSPLLDDREIMRKIIIQV